MKYYCEHCNKWLEFSNGQQFGGHKTNCFYNPNRKAHMKKVQENLTRRQEYKLKCEKCGNEYEILVTPHRFNIGRYRKHRSRSCANGRHPTEESKRKAGETLKKTLAVKSRTVVTQKELKVCIVCGKRLLSNNKTGFCGAHYHPIPTQEIKDKISRSCKGKTGGYRTKSGTSRIHGSYYKGIWMDSSWELRCAIRMDEKGIKWERDYNRYLVYFDDNGEEHKYHPDFYLPNLNVYLEIRGYDKKERRYKIKKALENNDINLLFLNSLSMIDRVVDIIAGVT